MTTMTTDSKAHVLLAELERLQKAINDPDDPNLGGRQEALRYELLPKVLVDGLDTILKALRAYCGEVKEPEPVETVEDGQMDMFGPWDWKKEGAA